MCVRRTICRPVYVIRGRVHCADTKIVAQWQAKHLNFGAVGALWGGLDLKCAKSAYISGTVARNAVASGRTNNLVARRSKLAIPQNSRSAVFNAFIYL